MTDEEHTLTFEALTYIEGLSHLFANMEDQALQFLQPFEMLMLLRPVVEKLRRAIEEPQEPEASTVSLHHRVRSTSP